MPSSDTYSIHIDGDWTLEDLYIFPHTFEQVYFVVQSLEADFDEFDRERIDHAYSSMPWRGGYSAVVFYNQLRYIAARRNRPTIVSIKYASPGWFELSLIVTVALSVGRIVKAIAASIDIANHTYHEIVKLMQERKLLRIKAEGEALKLKTSEIAFIEDCSLRMARLLGYENVPELNRRTGHPYKTLKILMSFYRRVRILAEYQNLGKVDFSADIDDEPIPKPRLKRQRRVT